MKTQRDLVHEITDMILDHNAGVEKHEESLHVTFYAYERTTDGVTVPLNIVSIMGFQDAHNRPIPLIYTDLNTATIEDLEAIRQRVGNFITQYNLDLISKNQEVQNV